MSCKSRNMPYIQFAHIASIMVNTEEHEVPCHNTVSLGLMHIGEGNSLCLKKSLKMAIPCQHTNPMFRFKKMVEGFVRHWKYCARSQFLPGRREDLADRFVLFCPKIMASIIIRDSEIETTIINDIECVLETIDKHGHVLLTNVPPHTELCDFGDFWDGKECNAVETFNTEVRDVGPRCSWNVADDFDTQSE